VLALRAMGEWRTIQHRQPGKPEPGAGPGTSAGPNGAEP